MALAGQFAFWSVLSVAFLKSRQASAFHPVAYYLFFHGLVFVLRPYLVIHAGFSWGWSYMGLLPDNNQLVTTLAVSSVGLLAFFLTAMLAGSSRPVLRRKAGEPRSGASDSALAMTAGLLGPIGLYSALVSGRGGLQMERASNGVDGWVGTTGYLVDAQHVLAPLFLLFIVRARFRVWSFLPLAIYMAFRLSMGWARWSFLLTAVTLALLALWYQGRKWPRPWHVAPVVVVLAAFMLIGANRETFRNGVSVESLASSALLSRDSSLQARFDGPDFANFDFLAFVVSTVPDLTKTFTYGSQYLQLFTEPIPRMLWKEKPFGPPIQPFNLLDYGNFIGMTLSLPGDGWTSGGWAGVAITCALAGLVLGVMHNWFWRSQSSVASVVLYLSFLPLTVQWFRDGGISIAKFALFSWLPIFVWLRLTLLLRRWYGVRVVGPQLGKGVSRWVNR